MISLSHFSFNSHSSHTCFLTEGTGICEEDPGCKTIIFKCMVQNVNFVFTISEKQKCYLHLHVTQNGRE